MYSELSTERKKKSSTSTECNSKKQKGERISPAPSAVDSDAPHVLSQMRWENEDT
jgi:hypothetical protein